MVHITSTPTHPPTQPWVNPQTITTVFFFFFKEGPSPTMCPNTHFTAVLSTWHTHCLKSKNQEGHECPCVCVYVSEYCKCFSAAVAMGVCVPTLSQDCIPALQRREHTSSLSQSGLFSPLNFSQHIFTLEFVIVRWTEQRGRRHVRAHQCRDPNRHEVIGKY